MQIFEERLAEIYSYLDLLDALEQQVREGIPQLELNKNNRYVITPQQQKILSAAVYIQLYSLVEATITKCLEGITQSIFARQVNPKNLSEQLRREWVRYVAHTHEDLNDEKRLEYAIKLFEYLIELQPIEEFIIEKNVRNWDDEEIYRISRRIGLELEISNEASRAVKEKLRNEMGALKLIRDYRNKLAHGNLSFSECGDNVTAIYLRNLTERVDLYLRDVISSFQKLIDGDGFLISRNS